MSPTASLSNNFQCF